jgi:hypothetical protein
VAVIVRRGVGDLSVEETEGRGEGFADSFRVRVEAGNEVTLGIVDGDRMQLGVSLDCRITSSCFG